MIKSYYNLFTQSGFFTPEYFPFKNNLVDSNHKSINYVIYFYKNYQTELNHRETTFLFAGDRAFNAFFPFL